VALALLAEYRQEDTVNLDLHWTDLLASHGILLGTRGTTRVEVALIPRKERQVAYQQSRITASFPPTLIGLTTVGRRYAKGMIMLADVARQAQMGVLSAVPLLVPFPYGNVYGESGNICWGNVQHSDIMGVQDLETTFFGSGFNTDLFNARVAGVAALRAGELPAPPTLTYTHTFLTFLEQLLNAAPA
jgi:hypothetical protein